MLIYLFFPSYYLFLSNKGSNHNFENFIPEMLLDEMKKKSKEYICRGKGILRQTKTFKYAKLSSSIGNFKSKEYEKFNGVH